MTCKTEPLGGLSSAGSGRLGWRARGSRRGPATEAALPGHRRLCVRCQQQDAWLAGWLLVDGLCERLSTAADVCEAAANTFAGRLKLQLPSSAAG